ncbi:polyribonucleotide nucleotidyltransferase [Anaplasma capra]|uniref:polyribonucleotide nucleotidyltransferase n=1 Tax=Anaplasma capra TaxID=1562740 RepID=UPI0021D5AFD4|nr:polyribonucleotide nucleotidyltransferase [Anaplasma capra]MCU7611881.1 polyribonucleotide nucleotidyltransferase [Anaplasma capra]MCU7612256.1 polyribonucleotide nucleotidyltransferase [Anaplasma capra]
MFDITRKCVEWGDRQLVIESGKVARQADGAVVVDYGGTSVLSTVVSQKSKELVDFLPLTVQFLAKSYAVGRIPGGFFKREGKPSDRETLISRLVDRSIRPLFPSGFCDEVVIVCNLLSYDQVSPPETVALIGAAAALAISGIPFHTPVAGAKVGYVREEKRYILNPSAEELAGSSLDMFCSGTKSSVIMVESEASELSEQEMLDALAFGHESCGQIIDLIEDFASVAGPKDVAEFIPHDIEKVVSGIGSDYLEKFSVAYSDHNKKTRVIKLDEARGSLYADLCKQHVSEDSECTEQEILLAIKAFERSLVRSRVLDTLKRVDGRDLDQIRNIEIEIDLIPKSHGSALFTRGDTQALVITALGTPQDEQVVDGFDGDRRERFLLHYNFPSYAVGEAAALRPPGRREIGHGKLAWRAIHPVLPAKADFPYTIRVVSEITESDGSSSMATVCGASLALMDTGVPLKSSVAGIAMGLIKEGDRHAVLSDIIGDEDYLGDMDFKVAGTKEGITALQMDMKVKGIGFDIISESLQQAKDGRMFIIGKMDEVIKESRTGVREHVPRMESMVIDKNKIKNVIGTGGKNVREICEKTGVRIEISQDGTVMIYAVSRDAVEEAKNMITCIVSEPEIGKVFSGVVSEIAKYGAFVSFLGGRRGLVRISEIKNERIGSVSDVLAVDDKVKVVVIGIDKDHVQLSMRRVDQESGDLLECEPYVSSHKRSSSQYGDAGGNAPSGFRDHPVGQARERRRSGGGGSRPARRRNVGSSGGSGGSGYYGAPPHDGSDADFTNGNGRHKSGNGAQHLSGGNKKPRFF